MDNKYTTISGVELTLKKVPQMGVQSLLFGMLSALDMKGAVTPEEITESVRASMKSANTLETPKQVIRLINFIVSYGIVDEPGDLEVKVLRDMGFEVDPPILAKKNWLLTQVLENDDVNEIMGKVLVLTFSDKEKK